MSHTDNTQRRFDSRYPEWLAFKVWVKRVDPEVRHYASRQAEKRSWRRDIELELSA